jgi:hypothetical protein
MLRLVRRGYVVFLRGCCQGNAGALGLKAPSSSTGLNPSHYPPLLPGRGGVLYGEYHVSNVGIPRFLHVIPLCVTKSLPPFSSFNKSFVRI